MADSDYGGYSGGGYEPDYTGPSPDYTGAGDYTLGTGLTPGSGTQGLNVGNIDISGGVGSQLAGFGPTDPMGADYSFDAPGGLGLGFGGGLGLSPEGSYGLQGIFGDVGPGPLADYSIASPSTSTAEMGSSAWEGVSGFLDKLSRNPLAMMALSKAIPGLGPVMGMVNLARASQSPQGAAKAWGGIAGSTLGGAVAGAPGALLGGLAGQFAGSKSGGLPGYTGERTAQEPGSGGTGMDLEQIFSKGLGIYQANREAQQAGRMASTLGDLYGQNSPYAQALRQQLERRDAAAGRRSQYGPREVELQAKLAGLYANTAPQTMAAQRQAQGARNQRIDNILGLARATGAMPWAQKQLGDLWNTPTDMSGFQTPYEMPSYTDYASQAYTPSSFGEMGTGTYGGNDFFLNY